MITYVMYDIESDATRTKASRICKYYGLFRLQKSVFYGELSKNMREMVENELKEIITALDYACIVSVCEKCRAKVRIFGALDSDADLHEGRRSVDIV